MEHRSETQHLSPEAETWAGNPRGGWWYCSETQGKVTHHHKWKSGKNALPVPKRDLPSSCLKQVRGLLIARNGLVCAATTGPPGRDPRMGS